MKIYGHAATRIRSKETQVTKHDMFFCVERLEPTQLFEGALEP
jgi:hypothetical protein